VGERCYPPHPERVVATMMSRQRVTQVGRNRSARGIGCEICGAWHGSRAINANSSHPTTHHSPQPAIRLTHSQISPPAATVICRNSRTCTQELVLVENHERREPKITLVACSLVLPPICWVDYRDTRTTIPWHACMGLSCSTRGYRGCSKLC